MLDDLIAARVQAQDDRRRVALSLQRIARLVVAPAALVMVVGLVAFAVSGMAAPAAPGQGQSPAVLPLDELFSRGVLSPAGAMSVGLLALALLPMLNVLYILVYSLARRRLTDAAAAGAVAAILLLGIFLGRA
jgi:hypothetical protein